MEYCSDNFFNESFICNCKSFASSFKLTLLISGFVLSPKKERLFPLEFNDSFEFLIEDTPVSLDDKG